jgi:hypothetical protein
MILLDESRSIALMDAKRFLRCLGKCCRTSRDDIEQGAWAKSSTMFEFSVEHKLGLKVYFLIALFGERRIE